MQTAHTAWHVWMRAHEQSDARLPGLAGMGQDQDKSRQAARPHRR